jgi:hypothetical protein
MNAQPPPFRRTKLVSKKRTGPAGHPRVAKIVKDGPKIPQSFAQPESNASLKVLDLATKTLKVLDLATKAVQALEALKNESEEEEALRDAIAAVKALSDRAIARMQA